MGCCFTERKSRKAHSAQFAFASRSRELFRAEHERDENEASVRMRSTLPKNGDNAASPDRRRRAAIVNGDATQRIRMRQLSSRTVRPSPVPLATQIQLLRISDPEQDGLDAARPPAPMLRTVVCKRYRTLGS
jgi:hypothetical protein